MLKLKPIAVIDANVLLSALKNPEGICQAVLECELNLLITKEIFEEIKGVIARPKFRIPLSTQEKLIQLLIKRAKTITTVEIVTDCRDPDDNKFLECALAGKADVIITGDKDLLVLHPWRDIPILSPKAFLELYKRK